MLEVLAVSGRLAQYAAAALLFGLPAFRLYGLRAPAAAPRPLLAAAAAALCLGALAALAAQAAAMTGDPGAARDPSVWAEVMAGAQVGHALAARLILALIALGLAMAGAEALRRWPLLLVGGLAVASFAWSGHGASGEGWNGRLQLAADLVHLLAASLWLGALAGMGLALHAARRDRSGGASLLKALEGFAGVGSLLVAALVVTGMLNSWYLVTPARAPQLLDTAYGVVLCAKLVLFGVMLGCAALNRFRLTPGLRASADAASGSAALRWSLAVEALSGAGVLALVAVLGILPPPAAMG